MLKKLLTILILVCYSISSFGVSLNYFYCCGKLKTISFTTTNKGKNCKGDLKKGCCKNEKVKVKLKTDQKVSNAENSNFEQGVYDNVIHHCNYTFSSKNIATTQKEFYQLPPPKFSFKRHILYCTYRI